jgi:tRNA (mo5U34)-methyltransferase
MVDAQEFIAGSTFLWHQRFPLRDGVYTPGTSDVEWLMACAQIPESLAGATVLDIGTANGGVAFEAERRGARRVVGVDIYPPERFGFTQTKAFLGSAVEFVQASIYALPEVLGGEAFDLVFFWGVLYHLRHPLLALDELRRLTRGEASIETQIADARVKRATGLLQFHRRDELAGDPSNWFVPTLDVLVSWCASSGLRPEVLAKWPTTKPTRCMVRVMPTEEEPEYVTLSYERPLRVVSQPANVVRE